MAEKATLAAGCFWGVEAEFAAVPGVVSTTVGYAGGDVENPSYELVCTGRTGHAECVEVEFDPSQVTFEQLLDVFWACHDPTTINRQGPDVGTQYRSAVFYHDEAQRDAATASRSRLDASGKLKRPVVTEITPAGPFYRAEEYHQRYFEKHGISHCRAR